MAAIHRAALPAPRIVGRFLPGKPLLLILLALTVGAAVFQVNQFSHLTRTSYAIDGLNAERAAKQAENHQLEADVAQLSSLARVEWEARTRLHLAPPERKLYLQVNQQVPDRQTLPTRFLPPEHIGAPPPAESLLQRVLHLLPFF